MPLPFGAVGRSVIYDCDISWAYSIFLVLKYSGHFIVNSTCCVVFASFFSSDLFSSKLTLFEKFFQEYHPRVKLVDPDQARRFVAPDLGLNCGKNVATSRHLFCTACVS